MEILKKAGVLPIFEIRGRTFGALALRQRETFLSDKGPTLETLDYGAIHTSELDRSEIDLSPKRSECERSNAN